MNVARLLTIGRSKAVRLPKAWIGDTTEVGLERKGDTIIIHPRKTELSQVAAECGASGESNVTRLHPTKTGIRVKL